MRWILGSEGKEGYVFIDTNTLAKNYISGNKIGTKYNSIKLDIFNKEKLIHRTELINSILDWIDGSPENV